VTSLTKIPENAVPIATGNFEKFKPECLVGIDFENSFLSECRKPMAARGIKIPFTFSRSIVIIQ